MPSAMTLSAATAAAVARSLNAEASRAGGLRERLVEARDGVMRRDVWKTSTKESILDAVQIMCLVLETGITSSHNLNQFFGISH